MISIQHWIHAYAPHSAIALYGAAVASSLICLALVYARCWMTGSRDHLAEKWIFQAVAAAAPIPTYALLIVVPFDADLAQSVLDDRVVVALAGLYGLVETLKDIRGMASTAYRQKLGGP